MKQTERTLSHSQQAIRPGRLSVRRGSQSAAVPEVNAIPEDSRRRTRLITVPTNVEFDAHV